MKKVILTGFLGLFTLVSMEFAAPGLGSSMVYADDSYDRAPQGHVRRKKRRKVRRKVRRRVRRADRRQDRRQERRQNRREERQGA